MNLGQTWWNVGQGVGENLKSQERKKVIRHGLLSMIHSARPTVPIVVITILTWNFFCLRDFEKWRRTNGTDRHPFENSDHCGSAEWIKTFILIMQPCQKGWKGLQSKGRIRIKMAFSFFFISSSLNLAKCDLPYSYLSSRKIIDPLGRPTDPDGTDHYFRTDFRPSIRYFPLFKISQNKTNVAWK